jgi:hypothetical protein
MMPKPTSQKMGVPIQKSMRFFMMMLPAFLARVKPASTMAKPACMKKTRAAPTSTQIVFTAENSIIFSSFDPDRSLPGVNKKRLLSIRKKRAFTFRVKRSLYKQKAFQIFSRTPLLYGFVLYTNPVYCQEEK